MANPIQDLQDALNCANKCDCCNVLQQQINQLKGRVNNLDQDIKNITPKVNSHEARIVNLEKGRGNRLQDNNLNLIRKQIKVMSTQLVAIERYINALDEAGKRINDILKLVFGIFKVFK